MFDYIDLYCERTAAGLWGEPLNALTNLAFLLAAWRLWRSEVWRRGGADLRLLVLLLAAIGIGSGVWHFTAQRWAMWADVLPIMFFIGVYVLVFLSRVARLSGGMTAILFLLFLAVHGGLAWTVPRDALNGSVLYLPAVAAVWLMPAYLRFTERPEWRPFALAAGLLALSVGLRSVDRFLCAALPTGTHFLWHLLNAAVLYLLLRAGFSASR